MADIDLHRAHGLGVEAARTAADRMLEHLAQRFGLRGAWEGNVLRFERPGVNGRLAVGDHDLHLTVSLGFLLKAMRGTIENAVERELNQLFSHRDGPTPSAPAEDPNKSRR
ncbi:MAG TPA: polyhydroxyalkanoic acid system family protein [Usitatibacter sp.]|nr:polyhydroxyalkanoic acid system family protein [Usitatibacter sp.]